MITFFRKDGRIILPHLDYILKSYYFSTEINVIAIDSNGNKILSQGNHYIEKTPYNVDLQEVDLFIKTNIDSKNINSKDTFLYNHMKKLTYIIAPYFHNKTYKGALIAGPILLNPKTPKDVDEILQCKGLPISCTPEILKILSETPIKFPPRNFFLAQLLHHIMRNGIDIGMQHIEEKDMKNTFIGKSFNPEELKKAPCSYNLAITKQLTKTVLLGNIEEAVTIYRKSFNLQSYEYIKDLNPIRMIKYNLISLCINLINASIANVGILEKDILELKNKHILIIDKQNTIQDLLCSGEFMVKDITCFVNKYSLKDKSKPIQNAINYINNNYKHPITLDEVANYVHLSTSYFSTIFKSEMKESFKSYLNKLRIEYSKSMLSTGKESILDIALSVGFDNQNYFSTVFKKYTNMSPKEYISYHKNL
ncbi:helix-turn-helix transcriptional regulator [Hathewaya massiliensis]|uniref:helix-turn-helix transcriptional regulator n=1 Tax=Hathewaya massiliensis TaxID=1964382 RepID=UPI00163C7986|nr:helix-turn-helix transcriptional regulator [Hathewaya massiliensis]